MEFTKKQPSLLYLDKNGFYFYQAGLQSVISLAFLETSVKDMDVINAASLSTQISSFAGQHHISPAVITIILSPNITFEKELIGMTVGIQEEETKKFIDTIPFDSVLSKTYTIEKGVKVIGCNDDMYQELKAGFEKLASTIDNVVPYLMLGGDQSLIQNLTTENAAQLLRRFDHLKQISMFTVQKEKAPASTSTSQTVKSEEKPKTNKTRLIAMVGVFAVLFAILGFMLLKH